MKIAFVLTAHLPNDERVWFQQTKSLCKAGYEVSVISSRCLKSDLPNTYCFEDNKLSKQATIRNIADLLKNTAANLIICDNPMALFAAKKYKKFSKANCKIVYDITEWYPSKKNLRGLNYVKKLIKFLILSCLSFISALYVNGFIFGEYYKAIPFLRLFFWKKYIFLSYYAHTETISTYPQKDITTQCTLFYSGSLTEEKGFFNTLKVSKSIAKRLPGTKFILKIISKEKIDPQQDMPENLTIEMQSYLPFEEFCKEIGKADIFLDLRKIDIENTRCLPIKLFYYMATGRPVIYSDLKAIRKEVTDIQQFGTLVKPNDTESIVSFIESLIYNDEKYSEMCKNAQRLAEKKYNWQKIEGNLIDFIQNL